jgi:hypothetical protein
LPAGNVPDLDHGVLAGLGDAAGTPQEPDQADDQGEAVGAQGVHVVLELIADDRELGQGGVQHPLLQGGVAAEQEAEGGDQDQQQGNRAKKPFQANKVVRLPPLSSPSFLTTANGNPSQPWRCW